MSVILALIESSNQALTASDELRFPPFCHRLTPDELIRVVLVHLFPLCHTFFHPSIVFFWKQWVVLRRTNQKVTIMLTRPSSAPSTFSAKARVEANRELSKLAVRPVPF